MSKTRLVLGAALVVFGTVAIYSQVTRPSVPYRMMCVVPGESGMQRTMVWDSRDMWISPFDGKVHSPDGVYNQQFAGELCLIAPRNPNIQQGVQ